MCISIKNIFDDDIQTKEISTKTTIDNHILFSSITGGKLAFMERSIS
jgi:hypothetical protein